MYSTYDYSLNHVREVRAEIRRCGLSAPVGFATTPVKVLQKVYNGIGPDRWSSRFRAKVTELLTWFEPEALVHDWEYTFQPKTYWHFTLANLRFAVNCFLAAWQEIEPRPYRGVWRQTWRGLLLALLCQLGGWSGYKNAEVPK